jgi:predicted  nucleic acid-binding Zn-ribbon protein
MVRHHTKFLTLWVLLLLSTLLLSAYSFPDGRYEHVHSFKSPFQLVRGTYLPNWEFSGSAVITEDYVRLTPAIKSRTGAIWNTVPVSARNWEVIMEFRIGGGGKLGADGLAFWYTLENKQEGPVFGNKDQWRGLAVLFDSFDNDGMRDNPQVIAIMNDGTKHFQEDGRNIQFGGCHSQFRNPYKNVKARIRYRDGNIEIYMDTSGNGVWEPCVTATRVELPPMYYFGMTAATGGLFDNHDVYAFEAYNLDDAGNQPPPYTPPVYNPPPQQAQQVQQEPARTPDTNGDTKPFENVLNKLKNIAHDPTDQQAVPQMTPPTPTENIQAAQTQTQHQPTQTQHQPTQTQTQTQPTQTAQNPPPPAQNPPSPTLTPATRSEPSSSDLKDLVNQMSAISSRISGIQTTLQGLNLGPVGELKTQIDQLKQQQGVFAEAFGDLLQAVATKTELDTLRSRTDQLHQSLAKEIQDSRSVLNDLKAMVSTKVNARSDDIIRTLEDVSQNVNQLKKGVEATNANSKRIADNLNQNTQDLANTIEKRTSFGFWSYFLFVQAIFIFGYIWWRKHREDANKKLI